MMNSSRIFVATVVVASLSFAGLVSAQEASPAPSPASMRSRAEVRADLAQARKDGSIKVRSITYGQPAMSTRARDDVRAELAQAQMDGSIRVSSITYGQPAASTLSRQDVRAGMAAAHAGAGTLGSMAY